MSYDPFAWLSQAQEDDPFSWLAPQKKPSQDDPFAWLTQPTKPAKPEVLGVAPGLTPEEEKTREANMDYWFGRTRGRRNVDWFLKSALQTASSGLTPNLIKYMEQPEHYQGKLARALDMTPLPTQKLNFGEHLASGAGGFAGFLAGGPMAAGKAGGNLAARLIQKFFKPKEIGPVVSKYVPKVAEYFGRGAAELGTAFAAENLWDVKGMPGRFKSGATMGAFYRLMGLSHITQFAPLNQLFSQVGGRALLALAGQYPDPKILFSKEFLDQYGADLFMDELLKTAFLGRGIHPRQLIDGNLSPKDARWVKELKEWTYAANRTAESVGGRKLPTPEEWAARAMAQAEANPELIKNSNLMKSVTTFLYNLRTNRIRPLMGDAENISLENMKWAIKLKRNPDTGELKDIEFGKAVADASQNIRDRRVQRARALIEKGAVSLRGEVDPQRLADWEQKLNEARLPMSSIRSLCQEAVQKQPDQLNLEDILKIEGIVAKVEAAPQGKKVDAYLEATGQAQPFEWKGGWTDVMKDTEARVGLIRDQTWAQAHKKTTRASLRGHGFKDPMARVLKLNLWAQFKDINRAMGDLQVKSGRQFHKRWAACEQGRLAKDAEMRRLVQKLLDVGLLDHRDSAKISLYYLKRDVLGLAVTERLPTDQQADLKLTERHERAIAAIDWIMGEVRDDIKQDRFFNWFHNVHSNPNTTQKPWGDFKMGEELLPTLQELAGLWKQVIQSEPGQPRKQALADFSLEFAKHNFGLIEYGNFLSRVVLGGDYKYHLAQMQSARQTMDTLSHSHSMPRSEKMTGLDLMAEQFLNEQLASQMILPRVETYLSQVLNLRYLREPLQGFTDLLNSVSPAITQTGKAGSKSTGDLLYQWAYRLKGWPVTMGIIGKGIQGMSRPFYATYTRKPLPNVRNEMQAHINCTHLKMFYRFGAGNPIGRYAWKNLPQSELGWARAFVLQFDPVLHDFALQKSIDKWDDHPRLRPFVNAFYNTGKLYPLTDQHTRQRVFAAMWNGAYNYVQLLRKGEISEKRFYNLMGLDKLPITDRQNVAQFFSGKQDLDGIRYFAKWVTDNTNYLYARTQKGLQEMIPGQEAFFNLFTYPKGVAQRFETTLGRFYESVSTPNGKLAPPWKWNWHGVETHLPNIVGFMLLGAIGEQVIQRMTQGYARKYSDLDVADSMLYNLGGPFLEAAQLGTGVVVDLVRTLASNASPERKKRALDAAVGFFDNSVMRPFVPFYAQALGIWESVGGYSYLEPFRYALLKKYQQKYDRDLEEQFTHAIFLRDSDKSEDTWRWLIIRRNRYQQKSLTAKNEISRKWYQLHYEHLKTVVDHLAKHRPYKPLSQMNREEIESWAEELTREFQERQLANEEMQRWKELFYKYRGKIPD